MEDKYFEQYRSKQAERLKLIRKRAGYTQEQMSEIMKLSVSGYKKIESGESQLTTERIMLLDQSMNVSADYLLFGDEPTVENAWRNVQILDDEAKMRMMLRLYAYFLQSRSGTANRIKDGKQLDDAMERFARILSEEREDSCRDES